MNTNDLPKVYYTITFLRGYNMLFMKRFVLTLLTLVFCLQITSCSYTPPVSDVAVRLFELYPSSPPCSHYFKNSSNSPFGKISREDFFFLYTGERKSIPEWDIIDDFYLILSDTPSSFELHVIRAVSSSDVDEVKKLLDKRAELIRYHNKTETSYPAYEPEVFVRGRYAVLAVTPDNHAVKLMMKKLLGGI